MDIRPQNGFTLLELLITIAIAGVLLGVGVPSFAVVIQNSRIATQHSALAGSLYLARSEAIKGAQPITVCARATDSTCGNDWTNGWIVFGDENTLATVEAGDTILSVTGPIDGTNTIIAYGSSDRTAANASSRSFVRFTSDGRTDWNNGSFLICDERGSAQARVVNIVLTGGVRRGRHSSDSEAPLNVFGVAVTCPTS